MNAQRVTSISSSFLILFILRPLLLKGCLFLLAFVLLPASLHAIPGDDALSEERISLVEWDRHLTFKSRDGVSTLSLRGIIQTRYEFATEGMHAPHSSMYFRRLRPDLRGSIMGGKLSFRIRPELARDANLRDAWLKWSLPGEVGLTAGQYSIPYSWERDASSARHHVVERSAAHTLFEWPGGRDLGVMADIQPVSGLTAKAGIFSGQGRNRKLSNSMGHMISARIGAALLGDYPREEAIVQPLSSPVLVIGTGGYFAWDNSVRNWAEYSSKEGDPPASLSGDVFSGTADAHLQVWRIAAHFSGHYRNVTYINVDSDEESYDGFGYTASVGTLLVPEFLFAAVRYSEGQPNLEIDRGSVRSATMGIQVFQSGHLAKLHLEVGMESRHDGGAWNESIVANAQYQLSF